MTLPRVRRYLALSLVCLGLSGRIASAQAPPVNIPELAPDIAVRPFVLVTEQRFAAADTFKAVFGGNVEPLVGGGAQLALSNGLFVDGAVSRFSKKGERAFFQGSESFQLGIPLTATITSIEITGGYRFGAEWSSRVIPYVGAGVASYKYIETADFAADGDNIDQRGTGFLIVGGAEFRVHPWVVVSADVQVTRVGGILGDAGLSKQVGESDLGGVAARFRVMIGR